ncbi:type III restriction endonuclease subunit M [Mycoplasma sp. NEAQ87857]|uniref:type III restriction endonuclease subunit M n=1 Tax=Mycoplasma sp. NEAQ87857 TaxID=2683967 RepID=UPI001317A194|nr:type III restriction endonuclease subunit M [Mycoplasma sp. NEAQ87857]QGZ97318.1 type III restriction endonuclease subunit M [Mycoplasma sp. NEAQ87857]
MINKKNQETLSHHLQKLEDISPKQLNKDQKDLIKKMLELLFNDPNTTTLEFENAYRVLIQRVKVGFTFDAAPSEAKNTISLLVKDEEKSFVNDPLKPHNQLIIGENYDALKNLLVIEGERESKVLTLFTM